MRWNPAIHALLVGTVALLLGACEDDVPPPPIMRDAEVAPVCPSELDLELIATNSRFDPGSSGLVHGLGLATGSEFTVSITKCDAECRRCSFTGPVRGVSPVISQRCLADVSLACTADSDCGGAGPCRFLFPPLSSTIGINTCSLAYFEPSALGSPVEGTIDLRTGELDMATLNLKVLASLDACPNCNGDTSPFDGMTSGTCAGGLHDGSPCDVAGIGTKIPAQTSFECPPVAGQIEIPLPGNGTSTGSRGWTMDATRPPCVTNGVPEPGTSCWCGLCEDGNPCTADRECPTGVCGAGNNPELTTTNNSCDSEGCDWNPQTQHGTCHSNPTSSCFPSTGSITARGSAEVHDGFYIAQIANLICMHPFGEPGLDSAVGLPGPFIFEVRFRVSPRTR